MIEHFPPHSLATQPHYDALAFHTRGIDGATLGFSERIAAHYTFLLSSKDLKHANATNGHWFVLCVYDGLVAKGVDASRLTVNTRANSKKMDAIDIKLTISQAQQRYILWYLKTSFRERWKQVDRDGFVAKQEWGKGATTICLTYAEHQVAGFQADCANPTAIAHQLAQRQQWSIGVDYYMALSQFMKVNAFLDAILRDINNTNAR